MTSKDPAQVWYRTDNAGRIFASLSRWRLHSVFRVSADLKQPVSVQRLDRTLQRVLPRFPCFAVQLRPGLFWYSFQPNPAQPFTRRDSRYPCNELNYRKRLSFPFRVRAFHTRIALEVAHVLTDGTGALNFLRAILADYLGVESEAPGATGCEGQADASAPDELEDAFRRYYRPGLPRMAPMERAFRIPGGMEPRGVRRITTGILSVTEVKILAKEHGATIGELLIATYLYALYQVWHGYPPGIRDRLARPIRLDVPVDLRTLLPSPTMRNFFLPAFPEMDPRLGTFRLDEIVRGVHHFMRGVLQEKYFLQMIARNVGAEQNPFLRSVPLVLKNLILPEIFRRWNLNLATSGLSNLGQVSVPESWVDEIERFDFVPAHPSSRGVNCGVIGFQDRLHVSFNSVLTDPLVERTFFRTLSHLGMRVLVETNQR